MHTNHLVGNGQMGNLVIRQIVNIQAGLCAHPQLVVRFELQSPHIGVQQLPRLAGSLVYLCQPVQRSDIYAVMGPLTCQLIISFLKISFPSASLKGCRGVSKSAFA